MKKSPKSLQIPGIIHIFASGYSCEVFTPSSVGHRSAILLGLFYAPLSYWRLPFRNQIKLFGVKSRL